MGHEIRRSYGLCPFRYVPSTTRRIVVGSRASFYGFTTATTKGWCQTVVGVRVRHLYGALVVYNRGEAKLKYQV